MEGTLLAGRMTVAVTENELRHMERALDLARQGSGLTSPNPLVGAVIVRELESGGEAEISSETIGELVMEHLRKLDDVAYVRFASVYRNFREAKDFEAVLGELSGEDEPKPVPPRR